MIVKEEPGEDLYHIKTVYFQNGMATAYIELLEKKARERNNVAFLLALESQNRHQGDATRLMREIGKYCLDNSLMLIIEARAYDIGPGCLSQLDLKHFYQKLGAYWVERREKADWLLWGVWNERKRN